MSLEAKFKQEFSEITPLSDNSTICRNVMERANKMKETRTTKIRKAPFIAAAAAVAAAAGAVTVGAVNNWDFNSAFQGVFGQIAEERGESSSSSAGFDFEKYGKELDMQYDCGDFTLDIKGICADNTTACVVYDVVFDEDFNYAAKDGWTDWQLNALIEAEIPGEEQPELGRINTIDHGFISQDGNVFSYYVMGMLSDTEDTFAGKTVTLDFYDLCRGILNRSEKIDDYYSESETLECGVHAEIPVDFDLYSDVRSFELNESVDFSGYDSTFAPGTPAVLTTLNVTPFSWNMFVETDTSWMGKGDGYCVELAFNLKDGTSVKPIGWSMKDTETGLRYKGNTIPYNTDEIVSVTVCGKVIPVK